MDLIAKVSLLDYSCFSSKNGRLYCSLAVKGERGVQIFRCGSEADFQSSFSGPGIYTLSLKYVLCKDTGFFVLTGIEHIKSL